MRIFVSYASPKRHSDGEYPSALSLMYDAVLHRINNALFIRKIIVADRRPASPRRSAKPDETAQVRAFFRVARPVEALPTAAMPRTTPWSASGVAAAGSSAGPTFRPTEGNRVATFHLSRLREKMLRHNPDNAIGTTGTGVRSRMRRTPGRKGPISPSCVSCPSGNCLLYTSDAADE